MFAAADYWHTCYIGVAERLIVVQREQAMAMWPDDADGDVLRRLEAQGFDFTKEYDIDFNVDFEKWPPSADAIKELGSNYQLVEVIEPETVEGEGFEGYLTIKIRSKVSYDFVVATQAKVKALMKQYGAWCDSWGVLHD
jgi:hypothetical protein